MSKVYFVVSGDMFKVSDNKETVFLTSRQRLKTKNSGFYSRNDFLTVITIPTSFYKENFEFERCSGIYRTKLKWVDIKCFCKVVGN